MPDTFMPVNDVWFPHRLFRIDDLLNLPACPVRKFRRVMEVVEIFPDDLLQSLLQPGKKRAIGVGEAALEIKYISSVRRVGQDRIEDVPLLLQLLLGSFLFVDIPPFRYDQDDLALFVPDRVERYVEVQALARRAAHRCLEAHKLPRGRARHCLPHGFRRSRRG